MITTDQLGAIQSDILETHRLANKEAKDTWVLVWSRYDESVLKREGIAVVENERLGYNTAGEEL